MKWFTMEGHEGENVPISPVVRIGSQTLLKQGINLYISSALHLYILIESKE